MPNDRLAKIIDEAFESRDKIGPKTKGAVRKAVNSALDLLDRGEARVAERTPSGAWQVNQWLKKAVLLSFRLNDMSVIPGGPGKAVWWDKVDSKFKGWNAAKFKKAGFRAVPGCVVRRSAYIAPGVVLMPSFVNLGAYVDSGTMIDTWATVGSCAQIGKNCHISGGAGIGGVLEPLQAGPVIIEDNCFVGARSEVAEGVILRTGSVLSMGVFLGASTKIVDRETGKVLQGEVPAYSVVVPGTHARQERRPRTLLRGHRQARRRAHPRQDQHQRTAAGLIVSNPSTVSTGIYHGGNMTELPAGTRQDVTQKGGLSNDTRALMLFEANKKTALVAYLLWFFVGILGGHNFYLKRTGVAVTQLILSITVVGLVITVVWVLVDAFLIPGWIRNQNNLLATQLGA